MQTKLYKHTRFFSSTIVDTECDVRFERIKGTYLVRKVLIDRKTGKEKQSDVLCLLVEKDGSLEHSLEGAMKFLNESDKLRLEFEFDGVTFSVDKYDNYEDILSMIYNTLKEKYKGEQKLKENKIASNINL